MHLDKHQVAFDEVLGTDVVHADHVHDLVELLAHLVQYGVVAMHDEGHAAAVVVFRFAYCKAVDIEARARRAYRRYGPAHRVGSGQVRTRRGADASDRFPES